MNQELLLALHHREYEKIKKIIQKERHRDIRVDTFMHSPVHIAVIFQDVSLLRFLVVECECEINSFDANGWTALGYIAIAGDPRQNILAQELIHLGADIDSGCRDSGHETPLDFARDKQDENPALYGFFLKNNDYNRKWESRKVLILLRQKLKRYNLI